MLFEGATLEYYFFSWRDQGTPGSEILPKSMWNLTKCKDVTTIWEVFLLRFGSVAIPNLTHISSWSKSGPRVAKTWTLHQFVDGFWDQNCPKILKEKRPHTHQRVNASRIWNCYAKKLPKRCQNITKELKLFETNLVACFCRYHSFINIKALVLRILGSRKIHTNP